MGEEAQTEKKSVLGVGGGRGSQEYWRVESLLLLFLMCTYLSHADTITICHNAKSKSECYTKTEKDISNHGCKKHSAINLAEHTIFGLATAQNQ